MKRKIIVIIILLIFAGTIKSQDIVYEKHMPHSYLTFDKAKIMLFDSLRNEHFILYNNQEAEKRNNEVGSIIDAKFNENLGAIIYTQPRIGLIVHVLFEYAMDKKIWEVSNAEVISTIPSIYKEAEKEIIRLPDLDVVIIQYPNNKERHSKVFLFYPDHKVEKFKSDGLFQREPLKIIPKKN